MRSICFIVCHLGSANQIADYQPILEKQGYEVSIYATGSIKGKKKVAPDFNPGLDATHIAPRKGRKQFLRPFRSAICFPVNPRFKIRSYLLFPLRGIATRTKDNSELTSKADAT